jgi:hypothetical protein
VTAARLSLLLGLVCWVGCHAPNSSLDSRSTSPVEAELSSAEVVKIQAFCGDCHAMPDPQTFPKSRWEEEVAQGYQFYIESKRSDLVEPRRIDAVRYFRDRAPDSIHIPAVESVPTAHQFLKQEPIAADIESKLAPSISHILWDDAEKVLMTSDMRSGVVNQYQAGSDWQRTELARVQNSCRVTKCDWNKDGRPDYLIADIGSFPVADHSNGKLYLLLAGPTGYEKIELATGLARLVEAQLIDFDGDGDNDILLAEFGWRTTGSVKLLRNQSEEGAVPVFSMEVLDTRHGALGVQVADLNADGHPDYLIAFGQEFETLEAYYGDGKGQYRKSVLFQLADPSYNASSFTIADVDADGLLDIVHTNGDTMDAFLPKPYHGVRWLRNLGNEQWENRELGLLVGALQACVADFDGDGDLDIAAVGMLPPSPTVDSSSYDSIVWWEQGKDLTFKRHALEQYGGSHAACAAGDVNGDGIPDLIVGQWATSPSVPPVSIYLSVPPANAGKVEN